MEAITTGLAEEPTEMTMFSNVPKGESTVLVKNNTTATTKKSRFLVKLKASRGN